MTYVFNTGAELLACCREEGIPIHEAMIRRELELGDLGRNDLREEMQRNLTVMRASVEKGLEDAPRSVSGLSGGDAQKLDAIRIRPSWARPPPGRPPRHGRWWR